MKDPPIRVSESEVGRRRASKLAVDISTDYQASSNHLLYVRNKHRRGVCLESSFLEVLRVMCWTPSISQAGHTTRVPVLSMPISHSTHDAEYTYGIVPDTKDHRTARCQAARLVGRRDDLLAVSRGEQDSRSIFSPIMYVYEKDPTATESQYIAGLPMTIPLSVWPRNDVARML